ncbi:MAG: hypothetical protein AVDCRST_MAG40-3013, partial [uncultured Gemmatimonadaceae bacterium]
DRDRPLPGSNVLPRRRGPCRGAFCTARPRPGSHGGGGARRGDRLARERAAARRARGPSHPAHRAR